MVPERCKVYFLYFDCDLLGVDLAWPQLEVLLLLI